MTKRVETAMLFFMKKQVPSSSPQTYPAVEQLIDSEDFSHINEVFSQAYGELTEIAHKKGGFGKSRDAKKVMQSLELTMDLFRELLEIKYSLKAAQQKAQKK